jgi:hypothetical protein
MTVSELHTFLSKKMPVISDSARQLAYRFGVSPSTVTANLQKAGYVQTPLGWELPTEERPVTVVLSLEDAFTILKDKFQDLFPQDPSVVQFTNEQRLKLLAKEHHTGDLVSKLAAQLLNKQDGEYNRNSILSLALAIYFSDPSNESYIR